MITLGIIGVVAAMTIPTLIQNNNKRVIETNLKKSYAMLQQVTRMNIANDSPIDLKFYNNLEGSKLWFNTYFAPYIKNYNVCYDTEGCWSKTGHTKNLAGGVAYYSRPGIGVGMDIIALKMANGTNLVIDGYSAVSVKNYFGVNVDFSGIIVFIDANGDKLPNVIGKDIYAVVFKSDALVPAGFDEDDETINQNCSLSATGHNPGYFCLSKVIKDGWKIQKELLK